MYVTCPDGQHVQYLNDDCYQSRDDRGGVVVRQSYPVRPSGPAREKPASEETSRTVMTDGTVIKVRCEIYVAKTVNDLNSGVVIISCKVSSSG